MIEKQFIAGLKFVILVFRSHFRAFQVHSFPTHRHSSKTNQYARSYNLKHFVDSICTTLGLTKKKHFYITKINIFHLNFRFFPKLPKIFFFKIIFRDEKNFRFFFSFFFHLKWRNLYLENRVLPSTKQYPGFYAVSKINSH